MGGPALIAVKTVAIADDTAFARDRFTAALSEAGHRTVAAGSGPELLAALRCDEPQVDLVVMDARLSASRGPQLLRAIQQLQRVPPIVVFSGTIATAGEVRELESLGVSGFINEYTSTQHIHCRPPLAIVSAAAAGRWR
jgi:CheY-like chemotaxis protein